MGERAERRQHEGVDDEARDHGALGVAAGLLHADDLLRRDEHGRRGPRDVGVHVGIAVDLTVAEHVRAVHVQQRHVGEQRRHGGERRPGVRILEPLHPADVHEVGAEHRQRRQERDAHRRRAEAQAQGEVAPLLERHPAGLDEVAEDLRDAPRQADRHPRGHDPSGRAGHHEELALGAREVAREGEPVAALPEELAHERHRGAREEAPPDGHLVAVLDPGDGVVERGELWARGLRLVFEPSPRGDEIVLARVQGRSSQPA